MGKQQVDQDKLFEEQMRAAAVENKRSEQGEVLSVLDKLRASRKSRGGTGAPLAVPMHLRDAAAGMGIVVTDRMLDPDAGRTREEDNDDNSDKAAAINRSEQEDE